MENPFLDPEFDPADEPMRTGTPLSMYQERIAAQKYDSEGIRVPCRACGAKVSGGGGGGGSGGGGGGGEGGVRLSACKGCSAVRYCNAECQRVDWPAHKLVCKILASDRELMVGPPSVPLCKANVALPPFWVGILAPDLP